MAFHPTKARDYGTTKDLVARIIDECGGVKQAAFLGGRAASQVYAYADPAVDAQMPLDMALRLSVAARSATLARHAAAISGGVFMPLALDEERLPALTSKSAKEHGALMSKLIEALEDGHVSRGEARDLLATVDQYLCALASMRAHFEAASR